MEQRSETRISAGSAMRDGFSTLLKPPFRGLVALGIFVSLVSNTLPESGDEWTMLAAIILIAISLYLQVALIVAAADPAPTPSADVWLKEALARRCFWRYLGASILVVASVLVAGVLGLVVGAFFMGGAVALADTAVVLERRGPLQAIRRSAELGKDSRRPLIVIFGLLVLIPGMSVQIASLVWDLRAATGPFWPSIPVVVLVLAAASAVAFTRIFLLLGGERLAIQPRPGADVDSA